ncbi:MAG: ABC transporter permease [bacterium]|nr:ABC transporter permease [bacterium]
MSYALQLGFRNVFRQRLRSLLTLGGIALAVALVIVGVSFIAGVEQTIFSEVLGEVGEITVARQDYFDRLRFNPLKYRLRDSNALRDSLLEVEGVRAALQRIDFGFLAEHGEATMGLGASAVDVEAFQRLSKLPERLIAGRYLEPGEKGILIGRQASEELGAGPGDTLTVIGRTAYESFMADDFEVVGVFDMGTKLANRRSILPLAPAQDFLEMEGAVSKILLYADDYNRAGEIAEQIRASGQLAEGIAVKAWTEDPFLGSIFTMFRAVGLMLTGIICFVAGLGVLNMMMVAVLERRREMGVLMALGMPRSGLLASFFSEAALYGLAGGVMGVILGSPLAIYLDRIGIDFQADKIQGIPFAVGSSIHGHFGPGSVVTGLVVGVLLAILGAVLPVVKTFSMGPQDAMTR